MRKTMGEDITIRKYQRFNDEDDDQTSYSFKDPFILHGYGVVAFFTLLNTLIKMFALFSVFIALPQIIAYRQFRQDENLESSFALFESTLANTGFSYINRFTAPIAFDRLYMFCENSLIGDYESFIEFERYIGLQPKQFRDDQRTIYYDPEERPNPCPGYIASKFYSQFQSQCVNQTSCTLGSLKSLFEMS